ncbi:hypothetical protein [Kosmotoga pacifica]|uniref:Cytoplasmic protein n=1 Tax=Kosmotoga pacifica TaxID=1330330 RepID=A0A0G2ZEK1_9BACT|nr:hypothetical protein [Kosmotoga pacifica]AKI97273.1 hypothetical protein IX53_04970 [Kosmotoga pacifica]
MKKAAILTFTSEKSVFFHALINVIDMKDKGMDTILILEGASTKFLEDMVREDRDFHQLYLKLKERAIIGAICFACSKMTKTLELAESEFLPICGSLEGHVPLNEYVEAGYQIITF